MGRVMNDIILFKHFKLRFSISKTIYLHIICTQHPLLSENVGIILNSVHQKMRLLPTLKEICLLLFCTAYGKWFSNYETKLRTFVSYTCKMSTLFSNEFIVIKWIEKTSCTWLYTAAAFWFYKWWYQNMSRNFE